MCIFSNIIWWSGSNNTIWEFCRHIWTSGWSLERSVWTCCRRRMANIRVAFPNTCFRFVNINYVKFSTRNRIWWVYLNSFVGARVVYNMTRASPNRVESIEVTTFKNGIPRYEPLDLNKYYRCITNSFIVEGGDAFHMIPKYKRNHRWVFGWWNDVEYAFIFFNSRKGLIDIDVVMQYLEDRKIIYTGLGNRIKLMG